MFIYEYDLCNLNPLSCLLFLLEESKVFRFSKVDCLCRQIYAFILFGLLSCLLHNVGDILEALLYDA